jgi:glycosyltransferase involved in cell wall biosynthesis
MKILILSAKIPFPQRDGGAIATLSLAEGLSDCGNDVSMLCMNTDKHYFDVEQIPSYLQQKIRFYAVNINIKINPVKAILNLIFSKEPYNAVRFLSAEFKIRLKDLLKKNNYDVVQFEGPYMAAYYIKIIRENSDAVLSLRAHNVEHEIWQRKAANESNTFLKYYFSLLALRVKKLEMKVLEQLDILVPISERDRDLLNVLKEIKGITIPTGLNIKNYPAPGKPEFPSLFFIGALDWMPNQEGILWFIEKVFPVIREKLEGIKLHIAGRNSPDWLVTKLKGTESVIFHGEVEDAFDFMNNYAIFVSPLFTGSGIRIKILEGMMMQRAVVSTSLAIEGIPATDDTNIIIADSAEEMISEILELCSDSTKYDAIARRAKEFVTENFNNFDSSKRLSDYYRMNLP